ncbi:MAG: hypothetical protein LBF56_01135 [Holosporales bacterium]|nr:hypothetical protein [Holosporales bacterium]
MRSKHATFVSHLYELGHLQAPDILNASRRRRIAAGSGQQVADVNRLVNQFKQVKTMMLRFPDGLPGMKFGGRM